MKIYYSNNLKHLARNLRNQSTLAEVILWQHLRAQKMRGFQFMRQKPIGNFIADFLCAKLRLIIEIDGESHSDRDLQDARRQKKLEEQGFTVMRLSDRAVKNRTNSVVEGIHCWIEEWEQKQPPESPFVKGDLKRQGNSGKL